MLSPADSKAVYVRLWEPLWEYVNAKKWISCANGCESWVRVAVLSNFDKTAGGTGILRSWAPLAKNRPSVAKTPGIDLKS